MVFDIICPRMVEIEKVNPETQPFDKDPELIKIIDGAVGVLKDKGEYLAELTAQESVVIMSEFVMNIIRSQGAKNISDSKIKFQIEKAKGTLGGTVKVVSPAKVTIGMNCNMENDAIPGKIKITKLDITTKAGIIDSLGLKAADTVGKTRDSLQDPNLAFLNFLKKEFNPRGVKICEIGMNIKESTLSVMVSTKPAEPGR